jgi:hypothetical protein
MIKNMDLEYLNGLIIESIGDSGKMVNNMELEFIEMIKDRKEKVSGLKDRGQNGQGLF